MRPIPLLARLSLFTPSSFTPIRTKFGTCETRSGLSSIEKACDDGRSSVGPISRDAPAG